MSYETKMFDHIMHMIWIERTNEMCSWESNKHIVVVWRHTSLAGRRAYIILNSKRLIHFSSSIELRISLYFVSNVFKWMKRIMLHDWSCPGIHSWVSSRISMEFWIYKNAIRKCEMTYSISWPQCSFWSAVSCIQWNDRVVAHLHLNCLAEESGAQRVLETCLSCREYAFLIIASMMSNGGSSGWFENSVSKENRV